MVQVQLRVSEKTVSDIDAWVADGRFKSRGDAIKTIIEMYEEKVRTMEFFQMLMKRSKEAEEKPDMLVRL